MPRKPCTSAVLAVLLLVTACTGAPAVPPSDEVVDNADMQAIVDADQADRQADFADTDWNAVNARDDARRASVRGLLESGALRTGKDFANAALVFQHGRTADDILLAHVLAITAVAEGHAQSRRLATLTLDRYLQRIGQPQVFGTQFSTTDGVDPANWTMEPYDRELIPDTLRAINCVESREASEKILTQLKQGEEFEPEPVCSPDGDRTE